MARLIDFSGLPDGALPSPWTNWGTTTKGINIASGVLSGIGNPAANNLSRFAVYAENVSPTPDMWVWSKVGVVTGTSGWFGVCARMNGINPTNAAGYMLMCNRVAGTLVLREMTSDLPAPTITTRGGSYAYTPTEGDRLGITYESVFPYTTGTIKGWLDTGSGFVEVLSYTDISASGGGYAPGVFNYTANTDGQPFVVGDGTEGTDFAFGAGSRIPVWGTINTAATVAATATGTRHTHGTSTATAAAAATAVGTRHVHGTSGIVLGGGTAINGTAVPTRYQFVDLGATTPSFDVVNDPYRTEYYLAKHRAWYEKGTNIYIIGGAATTTQPYDLSTVTRTLYGGHDVPDDLSSVEIAALTTAGFITAI